MSRGMRIWKIRDSKGRLIGEAMHTGKARTLVKRAYKEAGPGSIFTADTEYGEIAEVIWPPGPGAVWYENGVRLPTGKRPVGHEQGAGGCRAWCCPNDPCGFSDRCS